MSELTGINLAMQTPMDAHGSIDYARWEELIDLYIDTGVHGLVLGAGDLIRQQEYLSTGYKVLNGCDPNTVFSFIAGVQGCIWGGANYMPHESVRLFELVASDDITGAMELWSRMIQSLLYIWRGNYVPKVKAASRLRGFDGGGVRAPLQNLSIDEEHELAACLEPLG